VRENLVTILQSTLEQLQHITQHNCSTEAAKCNHTKLKKP